MFNIGEVERSDDEEEAIECPDNVRCFKPFPFAEIVGVENPVFSALALRPFVSTNGPSFPFDSVRVTEAARRRNAANISLD